MSRKREAVFMGIGIFAGLVLSGPAAQAATSITATLSTQEVSALLDKEGKKKLLRLVDAHTMAQEEIALNSFVAGFRLAWGISMELTTDGSYSYQQEWEHLNRLKHNREGVEHDV